jgi:hypothetical protein
MAVIAARATRSNPVAATALTMVGLAACCIVLAAVHLTHRPGTLCLLRATTGVPCPLCGGTTAAVRLGRFDLRGALAANPVAVVGGVLISASRLGLARRWWRLSYPARTLVISAALASAELWQLHRVGLLG